MRHFAAVFLCVFGLAASVQSLDNDDGIPPPSELEGAFEEQGQRDPHWISWAGEYQGDIKLTESQRRQLNDSSSERNGLLDETSRWPDNKIPYVITGTFSSKDIKKIEKAFASYASKTCLRIVKRTTEKDYVSIVRAGGCWSYVGKIGGKQKVSLARGCVYHATIIHEFLHAAGFEHEQARTDRDQYVRIALENVKSRNENNFEKYSAKVITSFGEPYDYQSVMHYGSYDFSKNGKKTIERLDGSDAELGNEVGFTQIDVNKVNKMYPCDTTATTTTTVGPTTTEASCVDKKKYEARCPKWASKGFCTRKYTKFMKRSCKKSCGHC